MPKTIADQLRDEINRVLQNVTSDNAPMVYSSIQTEMGYKNIEARVVELVVTEQMTPSACIPHLERAL